MLMNTLTKVADCHYAESSLQSFVKKCTYLKQTLINLTEYSAKLVNIQLLKRAIFM